MPTDKTNRFCTVNTSTCEEKIGDHLRSGWEEIALDPTQPYENAANELLTRALNDIGIDRNSYLATRLKCRHSSPPGLYPLGKDHKASFPDCKLRMVQPVKGSAIERLDLITGKVLTQILPLLKYRVDSSQRFIEKCLSPWVRREESEGNGHGRHNKKREEGGNTAIHQLQLCSIDVENMYPTLPTSDTALDVLLTYLLQHQHNIDQKALNETPVAQHPLYLATYVDDSISLWQQDTHAHNFLNRLNSIWPTMNFTSENAVNNQLSFLDVALTQSGHNISHELHQKPTHSGKYLSYTAHCEERIKWNIVRSETRRIIYLCSDISLAWPHFDKLRRNLTNSGYPKEKVTFTILQQVRDLQQDHQSTPMPTRAWEDHYILKVPYCNEATTRILKANIKRSRLPIKLVTTSGKTVAEVVKGSLRNRVAPQQQCKCPLHNHNIPCKVSHVVYQATCTRCNERYIGATGRPIINRLQEHENSARLGYSRTRLGEHLSDKHPQAVLGNTTSGRRNWQSFFRNFDVKILDHSRDSLGIFLLENHYLEKNQPEINIQTQNGYVF